MNIEIQPRIKTPREHFLSADEHYPLTRVTEFQLGKVSLENIANQTSGKFSKNWWVLNPRSFQEDDLNFGRVSWKFGDLNDFETEAKSNIVSNMASLIVVKDLTKQMKISSVCKIEKPEYKAFIEFFAINKSGKIVRNLWELDPSVKIFLAEEDGGGVGELFIPLPFFLNYSREFDGRVNCFSISSRSNIRETLGLVCDNGKTIPNFNGLMHSGVQELLIKECQRCCRDRGK